MKVSVVDSVQVEHTILIYKKQGIYFFIAFTILTLWHIESHTPIALVVSYKRNPSFHTNLFLSLILLPFRRSRRKTCNKVTL